MQAFTHLEGCQWVREPLFPHPLMSIWASLDLGEEPFCEEHGPEHCEHESRESLRALARPFAESSSETQTKLCENEGLYGDHDDHRDAEQSECEPDRELIDADA